MYRVRREGAREDGIGKRLFTRRRGGGKVEGVQHRDSPQRRYQECGRLERLWRRRHQLRVPYDALRLWWTNPDFVDGSLRNAWSVEMGMADCRMGWIYSSDEITER